MSLTIGRSGPALWLLYEPVAAFVEPMAHDRPAGWRQAAGACLELSIPELAFISARADHIASEAARRGASLWHQIGRVAVIGIPPNAVVPDAINETDRNGGESTLLVYCSQARDGSTEIVWAKYGKPVTFELSDFEKAAQAAVHGRMRR